MLIVTKLPDGIIDDGLFDELMKIVPSEEERGVGMYARKITRLQRNYGKYFAYPSRGKAEPIDDIMAVPGLRKLINWVNHGNIFDYEKDGISQSNAYKLVFDW